MFSLNKKSRVSISLNQIALLMILGSILIFSGCTSTTGKTIKVNQGASTAAQAGAEVTLTPEEMQNELLRKYNFGYQYYRQEEYATGLPLLKKAAEYDRILNPEELEFPGIYVQIGRSYQELGFQDSTMMTYEEGLKYAPEDEFLIETLAYFYKNLNRYEDYYLMADRVIAVTDDAEKKNKIRLEKKDIYVQQKEYEKAIKIIDGLIAADETEALVDERLSLIRLSRGEGAIKQEYLDKLATYPDDKEAIQELMRIYEMEADYSNVLVYADKYLALVPGDAATYRKKIATYSETGNNSASLNTLKELAGIVKDDPSIPNEIAQSYLDSKQYQTAVRYARQALAINSNYGSAHMTIGNAFMYQADDVADARGNSAFEDKLVYELAYNEFKLAARDSNVRAQADRWSNYLNSEGAEKIPTDGDKFMNKGVTKPTSAAYSWLMRYFN